MSAARGRPARALPEATDRFAAIARTVLEAEGLPVDPWLYRYCGSTGDPAGAAKYMRFLSDLLAPGWPSSGAPVVVDAGSGFGFTLIGSALLGARMVHGLELNTSMVATYRAFEPLLPEDVRERIELTEGTVDAMPYADGSADIVVSIEAISHYIDVDRFITEARRVLRPGGALIVSDSNNGDNPILRRRAVEIWDAAERGPGHRLVHGHEVGTPYELARGELIAARFPELAGATAAELARRTAGFTEADVIAAAQAHVATGALPGSVYTRGELAAGPDGTVMERLFSPRELARRLTRHGFRARALGYWGGAAGAPWVRSANRVLTALSPLTLPSAPSFRVIAHKR